MKVCGFTFIRNAVKFDYPVRESILSILPLCDEFVVAVGNSADGTRELIESLDNPRIRIIDSIWDESLRSDGRVLAAETDKALMAVPSGFDWAFYLQADEVVHEKYLSVIRQGMERWKDDLLVEGLLFNYLHFFGSYDYVAASRDWYRREVRIIRPGREISSYKDAQGFRRKGEKLNVKPLDAWIYHYGWVKPPDRQQAKQETFQRLWHDDEWMKKNLQAAENFDYHIVGGLKRFEGTHPQSIKERIALKNWEFTPDPAGNRLPPWERMLNFVERASGWRVGEYRNYRQI